MACFLVSATLGIFTTAFRKSFPEHWHIGWLNTLIWGGTIGLAVEHIAHREIVPWPPFLTAMGNPSDFVMMLKEMWTVGVPMMLAIVLTWAAIVVVYEKFMVPSRVQSKAVM